MLVLGPGLLNFTPSFLAMASPTAASWSCPTLTASMAASVSPLNGEALNQSCLTLSISALPPAAFSPAENPSTGLPPPLPPPPDELLPPDGSDPHNRPVSGSWQ